MKPSCINRRTFFRDAVRFPLLGGLAILGGTLLRRRPATAEECWEIVSCRECQALGDCALPRAVQARTTIQR